MLIVHVHIDVVPEHVEAFVRATEINAAASREEPGVARFDLCREEGSPSRFVLVEIYRTDEAPQAHKATAHYVAWRDAVEPFMASPRRSAKFRPVSPGPEGY